jgi:predicted ATPase
MESIDDYALSDYGCIRNEIHFDLTRFHALVGDPDVGKTTILRAILTGAELFIRFSPEALGAISRVIQNDSPIRFNDSRGHGLASVMHAISERNPDGFNTIQEGIRSIFPAFERFHLRVSEDPRWEKTVCFGAHLFGASAIIPSIGWGLGMLMICAFECLQFIEQPKTFLIECPENYLHPNLIPEMVEILRNLSAGTQVIITTHSPIVVDNMEPRQVSLVTRIGTHTTVRNLSSHALSGSSPSFLWLGG